MTDAWRQFGDELSRWKLAGLIARFWWRDDDATGFSPALAQLLALQSAARVPLALAVIPAAAETGLLRHEAPGLCLLQHGVAHLNRATSGEKKSEFPAGEDPLRELARLAESRQEVRKRSAGRVLPVLVPPWNRISRALALRLPEAGFAGLSAYGPDLPDRAGLIQLNTHVDIVAWRRDRSFAGTEEVLRTATALLEQRRAGDNSRAPIGWLTHHAVHDAAAWNFLEQLFAVTMPHPAIEWVSARDIFIAGKS